MLRATPGVTVVWRGTKITWPCLSGWTNLSCLAPPTLVQPSRLSRATILRVLVSGAGIDHRLMRQYRRIGNADSRSRARHLRALQDLLASGDCDARPAAAIVASLLSEWQTGFDFAGCSTCRAVGQRGGFRC